MRAGTGRRHTKTSQNSPGYLYVAINPAWPGYCKVGLALDLNNRLRQMQTNCPYRDYSFFTVREFHDRKQAEAVLHGLLDGYRVPGTEWFCIHPEEAAGLLWAVARRDALPEGPEGDAGEPDRQIRDHAN
ncbi:GIY-YIG nuclease family protein [Sinorhizobium medicae]|uniref:GIY-YIG nuclease family protein n=1 Tax=Sinorhizobium medicae TaxID=110321 RepID=UPI00396A34D6